MWCYFVEWEEDEATNTEAGECTWEPVSMMKQDRKEMVELFEGRMQKENKTGPPSWDDVMVGLGKPPLEDPRSYFCRKNRRRR
jgi:hypothetical protein